MAVTRTATVVRLGAPGDAETLESPLAHALIMGFMVTVGTAPGMCIINDKADGSGQPLFEAYLKSNSSLPFTIEEGVWCSGGFKANASNPAGSTALVYMVAKD